MLYLDCTCCMVWKITLFGPLVCTFYCCLPLPSRQTINQSINQVMRAEAEACTHEAARLEQAAAKLHALSVELYGRRTVMLETRKIEAAEETAKRWG